MILNWLMYHFENGRYFLTKKIIIRSAYHHTCQKGKGNFKYFNTMKELGKSLSDLSVSSLLREFVSYENQSID